MKDTLFVLRPGFDDGGTAYFCPYCAHVIGYLTYFPAVRDTLDIVELDFPRPRRALLELIGEEHQSAPKLVLGGAPAAVPDVTVSEANGRTFIAGAVQIMKYLAVTRGTPIPH